jgi:hypothetical protein
VARAEHLLAIEGLPSPRSEEGTTKVPPALLEEVFALNEELDEIRELRESGADAATLRARLDSARQPIERKREEHDQAFKELSARWDNQADSGSPDRRATLDAIRERLLERNYINNLLATIEREMTSAGSGLSASGSAPDSTSQNPEARAQGPMPKA